MTPPVLASEAFTSPGTADFWQPLVGDGAFALTRSTVVMLLTAAGLCLVLVAATRRLSLVPSKGQAVLEAVYDIPRNSVARDVLGRDSMRPFLPLLVSLFLTILVSNLLGVIPPVQFPTMSRIGFPIALMLFVYVVYLAVGIRRNGFGGYISALYPRGLGDDLLTRAVIAPLIFFLELLTYFVTRPVTLALRLFGNMFAGHIILLLFALGGEFFLEELLHGNIGLGVLAIPTYALYFVLFIFEILIEFLQAYIFTLLAAFYIADSLADHH